MTIGGSIALFVLGAILAFAVEMEVAGLNIDVIGLILMVAGAVGFVLGLVYMGRRRVVRRGPVAEERTIVEDREVY